METFIVLGFCFILYEALDLFQSCYTNTNRHRHQRLQLTETSATANETNAVDETKPEVITSGPVRNTSHQANLNKTTDANSKFECSSSESVYLCEDNVQLLTATAKSIQNYEFNKNEMRNNVDLGDDDEYDDDDEDENDVDNVDDDDDDDIDSDSSDSQSKVNVFSICDRVSQHNKHHLIDCQFTNNKNTNFNDYDKLIIG